MSTITEDTATVLNELIETCKDGQEGFRLAAEDVEDPSLKSTLLEASLQRSGFAGELQEHVRALGESFEQHSSLAGSLHRGWIHLKAVLSKRDTYAVLAECERGEDHAVEEYQKALAKDMPADIAATVQRQFEQIKTTHDQIRALRDAHKKS